MMDPALSIVASKIIQQKKADEKQNASDASVAKAEDIVEPVAEPAVQAAPTESRATAIRSGRNPYGGNYNYSNYGSNNLIAYNKDGIDPEKTLSNITQADYDNYVRDVRPIELQLIDKAKNDTSLIDMAKADRDASNALMTGIANRNANRYGAALTPAQLQQQARQLEMGTTLAGVQGVNDARVAQKDANRALMADLIDIGQGVNRSSLSSLGNAAAAAAQRESAFKSARAQHKAQTYSMLGTLGAAAIFAL